MAKTRIIESVKNLDLESTRTLLNARPSLLTVTDRQGHNLLHLACSASCAKLGVSEAASARLVSFLLDRGLDIESPVGRDRGAKPTSAPGGGLFAAGWWEDIENLTLLIRAGAPIDIVVGVTPFLACWCWRRFEAAKFLAVNGANLNFQDSKGRTALHHGVEKEFDPALLRWLVKHGASHDIKDHDDASPRLKASRKRDKRFAAALA